MPTRFPTKPLGKPSRSAKKRLISYINSVSGAGFSDELLTICFARRAAAYKRATLIFTDLEYLFNLSFDRVQFVFAGKAHPKDDPGKQLIRDIVNIGKQYENKLRMVFVPNYNIWLGALMTQGADVWLNTPRRPREACGTSGMKVHLQRRRQHERARRLVARSLPQPHQRLGHRRRRRRHRRTGRRLISITISTTWSPPTTPTPSTG